MAAIPGNAWAGTSVDCQKGVVSAEAAFANIGGKYHWLSCEPLLEPLRFRRRADRNIDRSPALAGAALGHAAGVKRAARIVTPCRPLRTS
jgi:hypothetical protein